MTSRYPRSAALFFMAVGAAFAALAAYFMRVYVTLENPLTHPFPIAFDYFSYVRYYYQTASDFRICLGAASVSFVISALFLARPYLNRIHIAPVDEAVSFLHKRSKGFRTAVMVVPLTLLEAGLFLYGGLMGLEGLDLSLATGMRQDPVVRTLFLGPLAPLGAASAAGQDYYFLILFVGALAAAYYRFGSVRRVIQLGSLAIIPLPVLVYLFDPIEFNTFFASVVGSAGLPWFSNAALLYVSVAVFATATALPPAGRLASRARQSLRERGSAV